MYKQRIKHIKKEIGVPCYVMVTRFEGEHSDETGSVQFCVYVGINGNEYAHHETGDNLDVAIMTSIFKAKDFLKGKNK